MRKNSYINGCVSQLPDVRGQKVEFYSTRFCYLMCDLRLDRRVDIAPEVHKDNPCARILFAH